MDFKKVLILLNKELTANDIHWALIGGFAMAAHGVLRTTLDIDLLVLAQDMNNADTILTNNNYKCFYKSENVSQYVSNLKPLGRIDVLHAFREISISMLNRAKKIKLFENIEIPVLIIEDIIGLKIQAMANDKKLKLSEMNDIDLLIKQKIKQNSNIHWELLREYFELFKMQNIYKEFRQEYGNID